MSWHQQPRDGEWRKVTLAYLEDLGQRLWIRCDACVHELLEKPSEFAHTSGVAMETPLLTISQRLRCSKCGEVKAHAWPEPYAIQQRRSPEQT